MSDHLGLCCVCEARSARNVLTLPFRSMIPGHGWGCVVCDLPLNGAVAVLCDPCLDRYRDDETILTRCCAGYPKQDGRVAVATLAADPFDHDMSRHPEEERAVG